MKGKVHKLDITKVDHLDVSKLKNVLVDLKKLSY